MRTGLKYLTSALAAGAAAVAIGVAPVALAEPAQQTVAASTSSAVDAGHVVPTGFHGGGGFHGGWGGYHGGWGGYRGWYGGPGWHRPWSPWGWYR